MGQQEAGFGLEDGDERAGHDVHLVFATFVGGQRALVAFIGQLRDACLRLAVCFEGEQFARRLFVEGRTNRREDALQE